MKKILFALLLSHAALAQTWEATGSGSLVELYTSEGCSSCPPADAWLSALRNRPGLWKDFVPVAFHVDYWDGLGWPDKFAVPAFTQRQRTYAAQWKTSTIFTPAIIIQGENSGAVSQISAVKPSLKAVWDKNELVLTGTPIKDATVHVAWLAMEVFTDVKRGENAGSKLRHDFIVLKHQALGAHVDAKKWVLSQPTATAAPVKALAVWLEVNQRPVVAAGGYLKSAANSP